MNENERPSGQEADRIDSFTALVTLNENEVSGTLLASYSSFSAQLYLQKPEDGQTQLDIKREATGYPVQRIWQKSPGQIYVAIGTKGQTELWTLLLTEPHMVPRKPIEKRESADWKKPLPGTGIMTRLRKLLRVKDRQPQE